MAQYDIHALARPRDGRGTARVTLVVILQSDLFDHLPTRLVAPLVALSALSVPIRGLNPAIEVDGVAHALLVQQAVGLSLRDLGPKIGSAAAETDSIKTALDLLLLGI